MKHHTDEKIKYIRRIAALSQNPNESSEDVVRMNRQLNDFLCVVRKDVKRFLHNTPRAENCRLLGTGL